MPSACSASPYGAIFVSVVTGSGRGAGIVRTMRSVPNDDASQPEYTAEDYENATSRVREMLNEWRRENGRPEVDYPAQ